LLGEHVSSWSANHIWCAEALNCQLVLLGVSLANKLMGCTGIEKDDDQVAVERECTCKDMSALKNILHGDVVHSASLGSNSFPRMAGMMLKSRRINLSWCRTFLGEMTTLTTVVAGAGDHAHLLQW
jgi:hypothetical protein